MAVAEARTSENPTAPAAPAEPIVESRGISMHYGGGIHALDNIDLAFPKGEMTTLLGPSGCGKTTLLKIIAGLLEPTGGEILFDSKPGRGTSVELTVPV